MIRRPGVPICLLLLAGCAGADQAPGSLVEADGYAPSPAQARVDRSISDILITTPLDGVRTRLTEIRAGGCEEFGECLWRDAGAVRYGLWADEPFAYFVVDKWVRADEFAGRPIAALGIGLARERREVLRKASRFIPEATFECDEWRTEAEWETCQALLSPGWVTIEFDEHGSLVEIHLTGYHYT